MLSSGANTCYMGKTISICTLLAKFQRCGCTEALIDNVPAGWLLVGQ